MTDPLLDWQTWAPPLDPPTSGGLPFDAAQAIADEFWPADPHLMAALQWEAYAATLPPTVPVSTVSTGAQSAGFAPAVSTGEYGKAVERARWHRSFLANFGTSQLCTTTTPEPDVVYDDGVALVRAPVVVPARRVELRWGPGDTTSGRADGGG